MRNAVVTEDSVGSIMDTAAKTIEPTYEEAYKSDDFNGNLVVKTKRKAKLKESKAVNKEKAQKQK